MWRDFAACVRASGAAEQQQLRPPSLAAGSADASCGWWVRVAVDTQRVVHAVLESMQQGCKPVQL